MSVTKEVSFVDYDSTVCTLKVQVARQNHGQWVVLRPNVPSELFPDDARSLGKLLIAAADEAEILTENGD